MVAYMRRNAAIMARIPAGRRRRAARPTARAATPAPAAHPAHDRNPGSLPGAHPAQPRAAAAAASASRRCQAVQASLPGCRTSAGCPGPSNRPSSPGPTSRAPCLPTTCGPHPPAARAHTCTAPTLLRACTQAAAGFLAAGGTAAACPEQSCRLQPSPSCRSAGGLPQGGDPPGAARGAPRAGVAPEDWSERAGLGGRAAPAACRAPGSAGADTGRADEHDSCGAALAVQRACQAHGARSPCGTLATKPHSGHEAIYAELS